MGIEGIAIHRLVLFRKLMAIIIDRPENPFDSLFIDEDREAIDISQIFFDRFRCYNHR